MARLAFCDYHNMIAILEKYEHNTDFHQIVDFVETSLLRYALNFNPTVYVSHIRQFWSTGRIKTTDGGTKILATVDGTLTEPHHTPTPEATPSPLHELSSSSLPPVTTKPLPTVIPSDTLPLKQYTKRTRIAQFLVLPPVADEPASPLGDDSQGEACPTDSGFKADQDRASITKTSTLPGDSTPRVTSLAADEGSMQHKLTELTDLVKLLEDREGGGIAQSGEDAPIKGKSLDEREVPAVERTSILTSGVSVSISPVTKVFIDEVPTGSGSIPTASPLGTGVPTEVEWFPLLVVRELKEEMAKDAHRMNEQIARDAEIARIHAEEELQMMIDGLDRNNETVAKYLREYHQFATELPIGRRIELISDLVKYQDNYAKVLKFQTQQRKYFKGMTLKEIKERFDPVWKQMQNFIPMGSMEEGERFKRKGLRLEHDSAKKIVDELMEHIPLEEWTMKDCKHCGELIIKNPLMDREDLNQLWVLVKETLNIRQATSIPTASDEFPLPEEVPIASEEKFPLLKKKDATGDKDCAANEDKG
nr:hypothetical protein [Tanacetum cinerariifolium]